MLSPSFRSATYLGYCSDRSTSLRTARDKPEIVCISDQAMPRYGLLLAAIGIAIFPLQTHAACYHVDGSRTDSTFEPCDPDAEVSACCATNKRLPDVCLSSGLCYSQEPGFNGLMYSNGCTDPTGEDEACPHFCPDRTFLLPWLLRLTTYMFLLLRDE